MKNINKIVEWKERVESKMSQMDQQMNMGLELLSERFGGRITFWCPVDIQAVMPHASLDEIRAYCRKMVKYLGRPEGGFMVKWYTDPAAAGHSDEAIDAMCEEFLAIGNGSVLLPEN